jgi:hypothetical protein
VEEEVTTAKEAVAACTAVAREAEPVRAAVAATVG